MKIRSVLFLFSTILFYCVHAETIQADPGFRLASVLQSNMVVQQNKPFKVWGHALPKETILVQADWMHYPVSVTAGMDSNFMAIINVPLAKKGNYSKHALTVTHKNETIVLNNLLIGDVWICSGQSNMQFGMKEVKDSAKDIAAANFPNIRLFSGGLNFSNNPLDSIKGSWKECTPETVRNFSAVAYYFGRELHQRLDIPVGIIFTGIGASAAQAYVPQNVLAEDSLLNATYLQPYLQSEKAKEPMNGGFSFEKVTRPFLLYNAVIHPFSNLSITGFTWYQGEANRKERKSYTKLTQAMIQSWRENFGQGSLPFYYVQVAPYFYDQNDSTLADYAFFREAQQNISTLGNTKMVVTMDVGEARDLHPKNKKPIGLRLAYTALNRNYGMLTIDYKGPAYNHVIFSKNKAVVHFEDESVQSGLETNDGSAPKYFFVAGADKKFYAAKAEIDGKTIVLTTNNVINPVAVRYAFTNFPVTNLQNKAGIPAVPFRTDDWEEN